jgi:glycosyltransferase 2 family protein
MIKKKTLLFVAKAVVSITLLTIIIINVDWDEAVQNFAKANFIFIGIAALLKIIERAEITYKWILLLWVRGIKISFTRLFLIYLIGGFWGLFVPSSVGVDVIRGYYLVKTNSEKAVSVSSIFVDRLIGMFSLLLLGIVSIIIAGDFLLGVNSGYYVSALFLIVIVLFYFFQKEATANYLKKFFGRLKLKKYTDKVSKLHFAILEYKKYPGTIALSFLITLLMQLTRVVVYIAIALAFNINIPLIYFFIFIPIVTLAIMIPVSVGGLGVREGAFVAFFTLVGMSLNDAVSISFTVTFINTILTLLGGIVYLFYKPIKDLNRKLVLGEPNNLGEEKLN